MQSQSITRPAFLTSPDDPIVLAWAAAWIDGEGHVGVGVEKPQYHSSRYRVRINIAQVARAPLEALRDLYGGLITSREPGGNRRPIHHWNINDGRAVRLIMAVRTYLLVKHRQADIVLEIAQLQHRQDGSRGRPPEIEARLAALKEQLHTLSGWSCERRMLNSHANAGARSTGKWSQVADACLECGNATRRHAAGGICANCYARAWRRSKLAHSKELHTQQR